MKGPYFLIGETGSSSFPADPFLRLTEMTKSNEQCAGSNVIEVNLDFRRRITTLENQRVEVLESQADILFARHDHARNYEGLIVEPFALFLFTRQQRGQLSLQLLQAKCKLASILHSSS